MKVAWAALSALACAACSLIYTGDGLVGPGPDAGAADANAEGAADAQTDALDEKAPVVVDGQEGIGGIAIDATYLYWTTANGKVTRRKRDGATSDDEIATGESSPGAIAVDATHVYWAATKAVRRRAVGGGAIESFATTVETPSGLGLERLAIGTVVYWTERDGGFLKSVSAGTEKTIADKLDQPGALTYFTNKMFVVLRDGQVHSQSGFAPGIGRDPIIAGRRVSAFAGTSTLLYLSSESSGSLAAFSASTDKIEDVLPNVTSPSMASDGGFLYFVDREKRRVRRRTL